MRFKQATPWILGISLIFSLIAKVQPVQAKETVVHAVLFYSTTCAHCHKVITEDLPPLMDQYQDRLQIAGINVSSEEGQKLYQAAIDYYRIPEDRTGVPTLIVGNTVLVGSLEIPDQFPAIVEQGLARQGIPWPDFPGMKDALQEMGAPAEPLTMRERFQSDLAGNTLAVLVLIGMIFSVIGVVLMYFKKPGTTADSQPASMIPLLALVGLAIAAYLAFVEISQTEAICGPVGNCNAVQQSPYAYLFGVIPVGVIGVVGYIAILLAWLVQRFGPPTWQKFAALAVWAMAWFGILFSIYLTFMEPFVIGATCAWCISSAVVMTLILWAATLPARASLRQPIIAPTSGR